MVKVSRRRLLKMVAGSAGLAGARISGLGLTEAAEVAGPHEGLHRVVVRDLWSDPIGAQVVLLGPDKGKKALRILIGDSEARAILHALRGIQPFRPITHDLMKNVIGALGGRVERVVITDLRDNTFYATVTVRGTKGQVDLDARPSDAIALALRTRSPIFLSSRLVEMMEPIAPNEGPAPMPSRPAVRRKRGITT